MVEKRSFSLRPVSIVENRRQKPEKQELSADF